MSISAQLRERHKDTRARCESHPFVQGLADGTLPHAFFVRWVSQDWLYLHAYVHVLEQAVSLASNPLKQEEWLEMLRLTRDVELDLHRGVAAEVGLDAHALDSTTPYVATTQYLQTLKAAGSHYATIVATLTPCAVGYSEIALKLGALPRSPVPLYANWIDAYLDPAFQAVPTWMEQELDRLPMNDAPYIEEAYAAASRCELDFWDGLWLGA